MNELLNESSVSLTWLLRILGEEERPIPGKSFSAGADSVHQEWQVLSTAMRAEQSASSELRFDVDSDIWLCKSQTIVDGDVRAVWLPPDNLDDFAPSPLTRGTLTRWDARPTRYARLSALLVNQPPFSHEAVLARHNIAVASYSSLHKGVTPPLVDLRLRRFVVMINQILAWLDAALGVYLRGILLTPIGTPKELHALSDAFRWRIAAVARRQDDDPFLQRALLGMHNIAFRANGTFPEIQTPVGQSELWRERWGFMTQDCAPADARSAIVIAARLLANVAVVAPLVTLAKGANRREATVAICSLRRLLLTLRTMTWAEDALQHDWRLVRPKDVLCFAYSALRPQWPRRAIALSHRSRTVKPSLLKTGFWNSPFAAVDATYAPQWETNIAMIWGLFASAPTIVRMQSPAYSESEWCQRESELLDFVANQCDFMGNRCLIDAAESDTVRLDSLLDNPHHLTSPWPRTVRSILVPLLTDAEAALMSAAGAVRLIGVAGGDQAKAAAQAIRGLRDGALPNFPCLTNNAGGWQDYADIFKTLAGLAPQISKDAPFIIHEDWHPEKLRFPELAKNLPDFGDIHIPALRDHLAAFEWMLVEEEALLGDHAGINFVVDCRNVARERWEHSAAYTLHRGLTSAATSAPVWFLQSANERVDRWSTIGDYRPIFTEHLEGQFAWMQLISLPEGWFEHYLLKSGLRW
jgi:hypothetical protein